MRRVSQQEWENEHMHNQMTEGEALAVLRRLKDALPDVGLNGWMEGVHAVDVAITALTAHAAASGGEGQPECVCCEDCGTEVEAYCPKCAPPAAVPADALERLVEQAMSRAQVFDDGSDGADAESAQSVMAILKQIAALISKGADHEQR